MKNKFLLMGLFLLGIRVYAQTDITKGVWFNEKKTGKIQFYKNGEHLQGKIVWLQDPGKKDNENPDEKLKGRSLMGLNVVWGFKSGAKDEWTNGKIYDPESGKTYTCKMKLKNEGELDVRGYVGTPLLGRTTTFTRTE